MICAEATILTIATVPFWKKIWRRARGLWESTVAPKIKIAIVSGEAPDHECLDDGWDSKCVVCGKDPVPMRKMRYILPGVLVEEVPNV
jgi:hypothetical protein